MGSEFERDLRVVDGGDVQPEFARQIARADVFARRDDGRGKARADLAGFHHRFAVGLADARAVDAQRAAATDDDRAEACEAGDVGCAAVGPAVSAHFKQQDTAGDVGGDVGNVAVLRGQVRAVVALAVPDDEPRAVVEDCAAAGHVGDGNAAVAVL